MMTDEEYEELSKRFEDEGDCPSCGAIWVPIEPFDRYPGRTTIVHDRYCPLVAEFRRREEP